MILNSIKLPRILMHVENQNKEELEEVYYYCFGEYPVDGLDRDSILFNIVHYLNNDATSEDVARVFKNIFV